MTPNTMTPYAVRLPNNTLANNVVFLSVIKQFFYPTIRQEDFCFNTTGMEEVYKAAKAAYDYHVSMDRVNTIRQQNDIPPLNKEDYQVWLASKSLSLTVSDEAPGKAKLVMNVAGYMDDANFTYLTVADIGEVTIGVFYLTSLVKGSNYLVLFGANGYDTKATENTEQVPLTFTPVVNFSVRPKKQEDQQEILSILESLNAEIHKEAFRAVQWQLGLTDTTNTELVPFVDFEDISDEILEVVQRWKDWNGGYDAPMVFTYSATVVPKVVSPADRSGSTKISYQWRHVLEIGSTKTFLIPLTTIVMS